MPVSVVAAPVRHDLPSRKEEAFAVQNNSVSCPDGGELALLRMLSPHDHRMTAQGHATTEEARAPRA